VVDRDIVFRHRHERREARFGSEQVVVRVVYRVAPDVIADREQFSLVVVQEAEIHLHGVGVCPLGDRSQPLRVQLRARWILHHLEAGLLERDQMPREVAAVDSRDVRRLEHTQFVQIVPVEEVPVKAAHSLQRSEHLLDAVDHVGSRDEAKVDRAHGREKLQSDVRRRRAERQNRLGVFLEVVRRQPVGLFTDELLEVHPVQLCVPERRGSLRFSEVNFAENRGTAQREGDARTRHPRQHQRQSRHDE
jgi:hypothetical protein